MVLKDVANILGYLRARNASIDPFLELVEFVQREEQALRAGGFDDRAQIEFKGLKRMLISDSAIARCEKLGREPMFPLDWRLPGEPRADTSPEQSPTDGSCKKAVDV